jgi:Fe2+ or Zn2+ uptake regulation protein
MGQEDIIKVLEESEEPLTTKEIAEELIGIMNLKSIQRALHQLIKFKEVKPIKTKIKVRFINLYQLSSFSSSTTIINHFKIKGSN